MPPILIIMTKSYTPQPNEHKLVCTGDVLLGMDQHRLFGTKFGFAKDLAFIEMPGNSKVEGLLSFEDKDELNP